MSYAQAMRWARGHQKGTRQPLIMSTGSGFWPAGAWLEGSFWPYLAACKAAQVTPLDVETFYRKTTGQHHFPRTPEDYAAMTKAGTL